MATLAMSLLSHLAVAICAGTTCAGPSGATAINPDGSAAAVGRSGAVANSEDSSALTSGFIPCLGKPAAIVSGHFTCAP
jgi:hypothetical protein